MPMAAPQAHRCRLSSLLNFLWLSVVLKSWHFVYRIPWRASKECRAPGFLGWERDWAPCPDHMPQEILVRMRVGEALPGFTAAFLPPLCEQVWGRREWLPHRSCDFSWFWAAEWVIVHRLAVSVFVFTCCLPAMLLMSTAHEPLWEALLLPSIMVCLQSTFQTMLLSFPYCRIEHCPKLDSQTAFGGIVIPQSWLFRMTLGNRK